MSLADLKPLPVVRPPAPKGKEAFVAAGARCHECPLAKHRVVRSELGYAVPPTLALVGEAPGKREAQTGRPFVGKSGELLNYTLKQAGIARGDVAIMNAIACGPIPSENEIVKNAAMRACRPRLITELRRVAPRGILAIGAKALAALAPEGSSGVTALRGALLPLAHDVVTETWRPPFFSTFHPAHIMRGGDGDNDGPDGEDSSSVDVLYYFLLFDLAKAFQYARGEAKGWTDDLDLFADHNGALHRVIVTGDEPQIGQRASEGELLSALERVIDEAREHGELTCDVETDGKDSLEANLTAISYGTPDGAVSATWAAWRMFPEVWAQLKHLHADRGQRWNWQNGIFDRVVLRRHRLAIAGPSEDCYVDSETEFLTRNGWKRYDTIDNKTPLGTIAKDGSLEWQLPFERVSKPFKGEAFVVETKQTRAVVTPNHRMWCQPVRRQASSWRGVPSGDWGFIRAEDLLTASTSTFNVQHACVPRQAETAFDADRLLLMGLWVSDGSLLFYKGQVTGFCISQEKDGRASATLKRLKASFGFTVTKVEHREDWRTCPCIEENWRSYDRDLARQLLAAFGRYSKERVLPQWLWELSPGARMQFLEGIFLGDGTERRGSKRGFTYRTVSLPLAEGVQALALSVGWTAILGRASKDCWGVFIQRSPVAFSQIRARCSGRNASVRRIQVDDRIVCFSVTNETLITRSRGKPAFYGNTLLKHHAAFPGLPHKLDQVAAQFFVTPPWKNEFRTSTRDTAELVLYNGRDVVATAKISPALRRFLIKSKTERVYESDRQINVIATRMREVGMYVDRAEQERHRVIQTARLEYMREALTRDFHAIEEEWRQTLARLLADRQRKDDPDSYLERVAIRYGEIAEREKKPTDIGLFKPKAKADIVALFTVLHIPFTEYTRKGAPVTDKKAMEGAAARHPLMRRLIHVREAQHLIATYIELPIKRDGRMHPDWKTSKITGRWGAGKSQNVPNNVAGWPPEKNSDGTFKTNALGSLITPRENLRSIITAPTAEQVLAIERATPGSVNSWVLARAKRGFGRVLVGADMDQVELRILAFLSKDPFLLGIFNEGRDPHSEFSNYIFPDHFPKLVEEIKAAGFKPKGSDAVEDEIARLETQTDDIAQARATKLRSILKAQKQWKRLRDFTKRVEYGGAYRGKALTIWTALVKDMPEVELSNVEHGINVFYEKAAMVPRWHNDQEIRARLNRESRETLLGRVRLFPLGNFSPTVIVNFPIQAYGASLIALAIFRFTALTHPELLEFDRLYKFGLLDARWVNAMRAKKFGAWKAPVELISNGHDSLLVECDSEDGPRCAELLASAMTQEVIDKTDGTKMVYSADAKVSQRWSRT